jgi:hypothetical protein
MTTAVAHLPISDPQPRVLLHGSIVANAERQYAVTFKPAENQSISEGHLLRFALHYYARVLYELAHSERSVRDLPAIIDKIASGTIGWRGDLFALAGMQGRINVALQQPIGEVAVSLRQVAVRDFEVDGTFGLSGRALATSVIAVLEVVLPRLSADAVGALLAALANMNASYTLTHHYRDVNSCREVPAIAYLAASFI